MMEMIETNCMPYMNKNKSEQSHGTRKRRNKKLFKNYYGTKKLLYTTRTNYISPETKL